ncbi:hypothetical protein ACJMK2_029125 [Sinanodonta woodiana]|uniref:Chromo domain-containing protein n=1 Tax=Sinanodonta woodiana TaxID=1069815 RepID=A0ABD3X973_SINWO
MAGGNDDIVVEDEPEETYEVENIVGKSVINGEVRYKIRWKGYGPEDDTWEPLQNMQSCMDLLHMYETRRQQKEDEKRKAQLKCSSETQKDTFWKEFESGHISDIATDIYSRVKTRKRLKRMSISPAKSSDQVGSANKESLGHKTRKVKTQSFSREDDKGKRIKSSSRRKEDSDMDHSQAFVVDSLEVLSTLPHVCNSGDCWNYSTSSEAVMAGNQEGDTVSKECQGSTGNADSSKLDSEKDNSSSKPKIEKVKMKNKDDESTVKNSSIKSGSQRKRKSSASCKLSPNQMTLEVPLANSIQKNQMPTTEVTIGKTSPLEVIDKTPLEVIDKTPLEVINKTPLEVMNKTPLEVINKTPVNMSSNDQETSVIQLPEKSSYTERTEESNLRIYKTFSSHARHIKRKVSSLPSLADLLRRNDDSEVVEVSSTDGDESPTCKVATDEPLAFPVSRPSCINGEHCESLTEFNTECKSSDIQKDGDLKDLNSLGESVSSKRKTDLDNPVSSKRKTDLDNPVSSKRKTDLDNPVSSKRMTDLDNPVSSKRKADLDNPVSSKRETGLDNLVSSKRKTGLDNPVSSKRMTGPDNPVSSKRKTDLDNPVSSKRETGLDNPVSSKRIIGLDNPVSSKRETGFDNRVSSKRETGLDNPVSSKRKTGLDNLVSAKRKTGLDNPVSAKRKTGLDNPVSAKRIIGPANPVSSKIKTGLDNPVSSKRTTGLDKSVSSKQKTGFDKPVSSKRKISFVAAYDGAEIKKASVYIVKMKDEPTVQVSKTTVTTSNVVTNFGDTKTEFSPGNNVKKNDSFPIKTTPYPSASLIMSCKIRGTVKENDNQRHIGCNRICDSELKEMVMPCTFKTEELKVPTGPVKQGADKGFDIELYDLDWAQFEEELRLKALSDEDFQRAVWNGNFHLVQQALSCNEIYDLECRDLSGKTLLMTAADKGFECLAVCLLENGAYVDAQMKDGTTALMLAAQKGFSSIVDILVKLGAKVNRQTGDGDTALMMVWANLKVFAVGIFFIGNFFFCRITTGYEKHLSITLNNTAKIISTVFPLQCFNVCEGTEFIVKFHHVTQALKPGVGFLLFIAHSMFVADEVHCRFYGPCAVISVYLNEVKQISMTQEGNFVFSFNPIVDGSNQLVIKTMKASQSKAKLLVCAYKAQLLE